jgi:hypothetical protein
MQLIQVGEKQTAAPATVTIFQMFEQMAQREAQMIHEARERVTKQIRTNG